MPSPVNTEIDPAVVARMAIAEAEHARLTAKVGATMHLKMEARLALLDRALSARSPAARIHWLRAEAKLVSDAAAPVSPCRAGCSHCCHMSTSVTRAEAEVIGKAIGRKPAEPPPERAVSEKSARAMFAAGKDAHDFEAEMVAHWGGTPCTFLVNDRCSIYEERPVACRQLISVEDDDLLCRIVPGQDIQAHYADTTPGRQAYAMAFSEDTNATMADIRDWFPKGKR